MSITASNIYFLEQGLELTRSLSPGLFTKVGPLSGQRGSIGAHLRHCIDCFHCFLDGRKSGRIDYDARQRSLGVEHDPLLAAAAISKIINSMSCLEGCDPSEELEVRVDAAAWHDSVLEWSKSSLGRELQFLLSHTVHHYALIAVLARSEGHQLAPCFGVAPSTLQHQEDPPREDRVHEESAACSTA